MTPFESFQLYHALKLHLTSKSYDYVKFRGKTNVKGSSFDKRRDKFFYHKLYQRYKKNLKEFYISVLVSGEDIGWAGDLLDDRFNDIYLDRRKRMESFIKYFTDDVNTIVEYMVETGKEFKDLLSPRPGRLPIIIHLWMDKLISLETIVIINRLTSFADKITVDHPLWDETKLLLTKYDCFVKVSGTWSPGKILRNGIEKGEMLLT